MGDGHRLLQKLREPRSDLGVILQIEKPDHSSFGCEFHSVVTPHRNRLFAGVEAGFGKYISSPSSFLHLLGI